MEKYLCHPLGDFAKKVTPKTRSGHAPSALDLGTGGEKPPLYAMADGEVIKADFSSTSAGGGIWIVSNDFNYSKKYGVPVKYSYYHCSQIFVKPGDKVKRGQKVGMVGSTGNSTGPHLHIEITRYNGNVWETTPIYITEADTTLKSFYQTKSIAGQSGQEPFPVWTSSGGNYSYCLFCQTPVKVQGE